MVGLEYELHFSKISPQMSLIKNKETGRFLRTEKIGELYEKSYFMLEWFFDVNLLLYGFIADNDFGREKK